MFEDIKKDTNQKMNQAIDHAKSELVKVRTGRANPDLLNSISLNISPELTNTHSLGYVLYTDYIHLFQLSGIILLVAMVGAIVLTFRKRSGVKRQSYFKQISRNPSVKIGIRNRALEILGKKDPSQVAGAFAELLGDPETNLEVRDFALDTMKGVKEENLILALLQTYRTGKDQYYNILNTLLEWIFCYLQDRFH